METKELAISRRFFKVMMPGFHLHLKLPPLICNELESNKTQTAVLHSRKGQWEMTMSNEDDGRLICLKQGWPEFVDRHALNLGDFIVFEHTGKLHFNVYVFDSTACEKEFRGAAVNKEKEEEEEETSAETTSPHPRKRARDEESPCFEKKMTPYFATKGAIVNIPVEFAMSNNLEQKTSSVILRDSGGRKWAVNLSYDRCNGVLRLAHGWHDFYTSNGLKDGDVCVFKLLRQTHTNKLQFNVSVIKSSASEKKKKKKKKKKGETSKATTGHPRKTARDDKESSYFVMEMTPYHASKGGRVSIPVNFLRSNNLEKKTSSVVLRDSGGRKWPVKLHLEKCNKVLRMCNGWHDFYTSNSINIGDVCVFKLLRSLTTQSNKLHLNVSVIKSSAREKKFRVEPKKEKGESSAAATGLDNYEDNESLCFEKKMMPYHATKKGKLNIPAEFVRSNNLGQKSSVILRDSGGKKWAVKLSVEGTKYGDGVCLRMCTGWIEFYEAKNLKDGDVCVFKLKQSSQTQTDIFFDVQINRA